MARIFDATDATRPPAWALTRASAGSYFNSSGVLSSAAVDTERLDYQFSGSWVLGGLLYEPARTTISPYSENADGYNPYISGTVTDDTQTSPDGTTNADTVTLAADGYIYWGAYNSGTGTWRGSVWLKAASNMTVGFRITDEAGTYSVVTTIGITTDWQRFEIASAMGTDPQRPQFGIDTRTFTGDDGAAATFYAFGQNLIKDDASAASSYIYNVSGGSATRSADAASFTLDATATELTFTFDNASTQVISGLTPSSTYNIPTTLNRSRIKYIDDNSAAAGGQPAMRRHGGIPGMTPGGHRIGRTWFQGLALPVRRPVFARRSRILLPGRDFKTAA